MAEDTGEENTVDGAVGGCPFSISGDDDYGEEHQGEAVCGKSDCRLALTMVGKRTIDRAETTYES